MKIVSTIALGLALALAQGATPALAKDKKEPAAEQGGGIKISPKLSPIAAEIQKGLAAKDWATVKAKADEGLPLATTPDDKYYIGIAYVQVGEGLKDQVTETKGADLVIESGKADAKLLPTIWSIKGQIAYVNKNYQAAEPALTQAATLGADDPNIVPMLVDAKRNLGKPREALETLNAAIAKKSAAGQPVPPEWYGRGFEMGFKAQPGTPDYQAIHDAGQQINLRWAAASPTASVWHDVLLYVTKGRSGDSDFILDANRLALQAGGLVNAPEYADYADRVYQKNPAEAKMVIDAGLKKNAFTLASNQTLKEINANVGGRLAADKASLPASEKTAQTNGKVALNVADAYYGYGNYAKAVEFYKLAGSKGADADLIAIRTGTALAASGDAAGAKAAFAQVKAGPRKDLADLWLVHLDHPTQG